MTKLSYFQSALLIVILAGILIVAFGIFRVLETTSKFNELDAIPVQALVDTATQNPTNATTLALLDKGKKDALIGRSQALSIIGFGAVILGVAGFAFAQFSQSKPSNSGVQSTIES
jgi:uncharacterized membrane protein